MRKAEGPKRASKRTPARPVRQSARPAPKRRAEVKAKAASTGRAAAALQRELDRARERQTAVSEILRAISGSPGDLQPVLDAIATNANRYCGSEDAFVYLISGDQYVARAHEGPIETRPDALPEVRRDMVMGRAILERTVVHVPDLLAPDTAKEFPRGAEVARKSGFHAALAAPLIRDGAVIGVIGLRRREARPFTEDQVTLVRTFAEQAVIAIENVRLFNETKEALERQTATAEVLKVISRSAQDLQPVFQAILESATRLSGTTRGGIYIREGNVLRSVVHVGLPPGRAEYLEANPETISMDNFIGRAFLTREVLHVADASNEPSPSDESPLAIRPRTVLAIPMVQQGQAIGVIALTRGEVRPFLPNDISLVTTFADQAVIAIENVRLFNETKEALGQQTAISDVLTSISRSAFDLDEVLRTVLSRARELCAADHAMVIRRDITGFRLVAYSGDAPQMAGRGGTNYSLGPGDEEAMRTRRRVHITDLDPASLPESSFTRKTGSRCRLVVPLVRDDDAIGFIVLARTRPEGFADRQITVVETFADQAVIAIENVRLFNETKEALERQTALAGILRAISASPTNVQPVLDAIAENAARFCAAEDATVGLLDGPRYIIRAHFGGVELRSGAASGTVTELNDRFVTGRAIVERRTIHVPDLQAASDRYPEGAAVSPTTRAIVATPLLRMGEPIGGIFLRRTSPTPFTDSQIGLVEAFAQQAVIAIENVRLFNETKESLERQTAIGEVLRAIGSSAFDLQPVFEISIQRAVQLCTADSGTIFRLEQGRAQRVADAGRFEYPEGAREKDLWRPIEASRRTLTGRVLLAGATVQIEDTASDPEYDSPDVMRVGEGSHLGVPISRDGKPVGVFILRRRSARAFSEREIALVETFADQVGIAIENVRLFNETKEALERQTAVSEILKVISSSPDSLQPIFDAIAAATTRFCGAEDASVMLISDGLARPVAHYGPIDIASGVELDKESVTGAAILEGRTVHVTDVTAVPDFPKSKRFAETEDGQRTVLATPLTRAGAVIGAVVLRRKEPESFSPRQVELVETFADQAVIAIENVRLFKEIQDKSHQLEVASRHKSEFLANMSHELRTPLNAIIGFTDVMLQEMFGPLNDKQKEYLDDVRGSGAHLLTLINDILDLSKIEAGRVELELSEFSLSDAIENALTLVRERAARHGITLAADVAPDVGHIVADERKIKQIVVNLLSNAVKFTPERGWVGITARCDGERIEVAVRDTGIGIAAEDQERVFEEFQQVGKDPDRSREGTGLGLTLSKRFVELHGGRLWVESELGKGSTFTLTIPVRQTATAPVGAQR